MARSKQTARPSPAGAAREAALSAKEAAAAAAPAAEAELYDGDDGAPEAADDNATMATDDDGTVVQQEGEPEPKPARAPRRRLSPEERAERDSAEKRESLVKKAWRKHAPIVRLQRKGKEPGKLGVAVQAMRNLVSKLVYEANGNEAVYVSTSPEVTRAALYYIVGEIERFILPDAHQRRVSQRAYKTPEEERQANLTARIPSRMVVDAFNTYLRYTDTDPSFSQAAYFHDLLAKYDAAYMADFEVHREAQRQAEHIKTLRERILKLRKDEEEGALNDEHVAGLRKDEADYAALRSEKLSRLISIVKKRIENLHKETEKEGEALPEIEKERADLEVDGVDYITRHRALAVAEQRFEAAKRAHESHKDELRPRVEELRKEMGAKYEPIHSRRAFSADFKQLRRLATDRREARALLESRRRRVKNIPGHTKKLDDRIAAKRKYITVELPERLKAQNDKLDAYRIELKTHRRTLREVFAALNASAPAPAPAAAPAVAASAKPAPKPKPAAAPAAAPAAEA